MDAVTELSFRGAKSMPAKLNEYKEQLLMSRELATIKLDVAMDLQPEELKIQTADSENCRSSTVVVNSAGGLVS